MTRRAALLALLLVPALAACAGGASTGAADTDVPVAAQDASSPNGGVQPAASCQADSDCAAGQACYAAGGVCVALPPASQSFSVQVDPPPDSLLVADQFADLAIDASGTLDLTLATPVTLQGQVFHAAAGQEWMGAARAEVPASPDALAAGRMVAAAAGRVPGTEFRSEASVAAWDAARPDAPLFTLRLLPNVDYQVTFIPGKGEFEALPPYSFPLEAGEDGTSDVVLPPVDAYLHLQGMVREGGDAGQPVAGAEVVGRVGDDTAGTTAVTDGDGVFSLVLPPADGAVDIAVSPTRNSPAFPKRHFTWDGGLAAIQAQYDASPFLTLDVDPVPAVRIVAVQVLGIAGDTVQPVALARMAAVGQAGGGEASAVTGTDGSGLATLSLLEGQYALAVAPPVGSPWAASETSLDLLMQKGDKFQVPLSARVTVSGRVLRQATGAPVAGALVSFLTDRQDTLSEAAQSGVFEAAFTATTADDGSYSLRVDPGAYALTVAPPARSGLPRVSYPSVDVTQGRTVDVPLPEGALVRGHLRADDGTPLPGASITFFFPVTAAAAGATWSLGDTSFAATLQTVAEADAGTDGAFAVVLPVRSTGSGTNEPGGGQDKGRANFGLPALDVR